MLSAVVAVEGDGLITDDPAGAIGRPRVQATGSEIGFGTGHKEGAGLVQDVEALKVQIPTVHHVDRAGFGDEQIPRTLTSCNFPSEM